MPNAAQRELLESFIAAEGIYIEVINGYAGVDLGTKVLYLDRAINQDCQTFLQSLDKLYNPDLTGEARTANLEFIRALKNINDLCFNNDVKYGEFGTRAALTHYFGSLGTVNAEEFETTIQDLINARIVALEEQQETVLTQRAARVQAEGDIARQSGWRNELDLPSAQLDNPVAQVVDNPVPQEVPEQVLPHQVPQGFFQEQEIPSWVSSMAAYTSLTSAQIWNYHQNEPENYARIERLQRYLRNFNLGVAPGLSLEQVLATTVQESLNLSSLEDWIRTGVLTIEQARDVTEDQRMNFVYLQELSVSLGIAFPHLYNYQQNQADNFSRIILLRKYIHDYHELGEGLSLIMALAATPQEASNLATAYPFIEQDLLTMQEARELQEEERMILHNGFNDIELHLEEINNAGTYPQRVAAVFQQLQQHRQEQQGVSSLPPQV